MTDFKVKRSIDAIDDIYREAIASSADEGRVEQGELSEDFLSGDVFSADGATDGSYGQVVMQNLAAHDPAWFGKEIAVSADKMRVTLKVNGGKPLSSYQLNHGLEQLGISFGIDWPAMAACESQSATGWQGEMVVARGISPGVRQSVVFPDLDLVRLLGLDGTYYWLADGVRLKGAELRAALSSDKLERIEGSSLLVKAVAAEAVLVEVSQNLEASPGQNVFGEIIDPINDPLPEFGDHIRHDEAKGIYVADRYGYLVLEGNSMAVLPPVWLAPDHLAAYYVSLSQIGAPLLPTAADLLSSLLEQGVRENTIRRTLIEKLLQRLAAGEVLPRRAVKIAEAIPPRHGRNAHFSFYVDMGGKASDVLADGTIDLRDRAAVVMVEAGALVAEKVTATKGVDGYDLLGETLVAEDGVDQHMAVDDTLRLEEGPDKIVYHARKGGNIRFGQQGLTVADVFLVRGDVDANVGDLDRQEDILINGSLLAGLTVKSRGNIAIMGSVYSGAKVVGADISIGEGIVGAATRVVALGHLQVLFVQEAEVIVKGDALVRGYLYNAVLRANGAISVLRDHGHKSGRIIGGLTCASHGIRASSVGHPGLTGTVVAILPDPVCSAQLARLEEEARICRENIAKVSRSLPFDNFEPAAIKRALAALPDDKREAAVKLLTAFNNLIKRQQNVEALRKEINAKIAAVQRSATIEVGLKVFQGSEIRFGEKTLLISAELGPTTFSLQGGEIV